MDKSKEFVKMCQEAEEIQKLKPFDEDCGFHNRKENIHISNANFYEQHLEKDKFNHYKNSIKIWLPRQDQLQEMVKGNWIQRQVRFYDFIFITAKECCVSCFNAQNFKDSGKFYEEAERVISETWKSFEQAWLAFVMSEQYQKYWTGTEWKKK